MVMTDYARQIMAVRLGSKLNWDLGSAYIAIGSGSGTISVSTTSLVSEFDRNMILLPASYAVSQEMQMTAVFDSVELSGLNLRQFGVFVQNTGGNAWLVENVSPQVNFNGTQELQVEISLRVF